MSTNTLVMHNICCNTAMSSDCRDVPLTYELLGHLDHGRQQQRVLKKKKYSCGIIAFNFAVRGQLSKLSHHNVFLSSESYISSASQPVVFSSQHILHLFARA
jgi:hypothetical protein